MSGEADRVEGMARQFGGGVQDKVGGLVGDASTQAKGKLNEAVGSAQDAYGKIKDQAQDLLNQSRDKLQDHYGDIETFVREQPLTALGAGLGVGLLLGLLLSAGRKVVYVSK